MKCLPYLSLLLEVALVADQDDGEMVRILDPQDLSDQLVDVVERVLESFGSLIWMSHTGTSTIELDQPRLSLTTNWHNTTQCCKHSHSITPNLLQKWLKK
jgi:hypothetical protein